MYIYIYIVTVQCTYSFCHKIYKGGVQALFFYFFTLDNMHIFIFTAFQFKFEMVQSECQYQEICNSRLLTPHLYSIESRLFE